MRKYIFIILLNALAYTCANAQSFCDLATPVGTSYTDTLTEPGVHYYSSWTYDLPMDMYFIASDPNCATPPDMWFDLTCTPGIYDDPNIQQLLPDTAKYGISIPMKIGCETTWVDSLGTYVHHLKLGKSYRNRLKLVGIDYNVKAYVKVVSTCSGIAQIAQDTSSNACYKDARRINVTDSTHVLANDSLNTYIFTYKDWMAQADSVALYWEGNEPVRIWIEGNECDFITDVQHAWDYYDIPANGEYHLSRMQMKDALNSGTQDSTGFFYAKIFSAEEGRLFTRPLIAETKGATLLRYDSIQTVHVDSNAFYCFPKEWTGVEWIANTRRVIKLYLHTSPDTTAVDSFSFDLPDVSSFQRVLVWSIPEMKTLRNYASGELLFVRFECSGDFTFTPMSLPDQTACTSKAIRIRSGIPVNCSKDQILGLYYADWEGFPMKINCKNNNSGDLQNLFIADTCEFTLRWSTNATKKRCVYYKQTARGGEVITLDSATVTEWKERVSPEGYFYVRTTATGTITITNNKPAEQDPDDGLPLDPPNEDPGTLTGFENHQPKIECTKILYRGQIIILRAGKAYTITGQPIKID